MNKLIIELFKMNEMAKKLGINDFLNKNIIETVSNIYDPINYLDDARFSIDVNSDRNPEEITDEELIIHINRIINVVRNLQYPIKVYRGLKTNDNSLDLNNNIDIDGGHWTTRREVAEGFGTVIFIGLIQSENDVDIEQTIRTRVMIEDEAEINVKSSGMVKIIDKYVK